MLKKLITTGCLLLFSSYIWFSISLLNVVYAKPTAPYLLPDAPTFDLTIASFRKKYNRVNPTLQIGEFRVIPGENSPLLTRAASKLNENLYASTALEKGTGKIKTLQITHLPQQGVKEKAAYAIAISYMAAIMRQFEPSLSIEQSVKKVNSLLEKGKKQHFYQQEIGAIRYVVVDNTEQNLTFAVEPVKLALSSP